MFEHIQMIQLRGWLAYCTGDFKRTQADKACSRCILPW